MKLSTKGKYGTRLMLDLALNYRKRQLLLKEMASNQGISEKYLWQLISSLKNAGLINSTRGAQGGYELAKPPKSITLKEIILPLEGPLDFTESSDDVKADYILTSVTNEIWEDISAKLKKILSSVTLEQMVERQEKRSRILEYAI
ncbi:MAG: Rrf2 family transcriptional regulator [Candidatus Omnitrophica bacterium]|nr:Rrf2 family transcriptional regulator [Candidatus Omnitrophota bacterium]